MPKELLRLNVHLSGIYSDLVPIMAINKPFARSLNQLFKALADLQDDLNLPTPEDAFERIEFELPKELVPADGGDFTVAPTLSNEEAIEFVKSSHNPSGCLRRVLRLILRFKANGIATIGGMLYAIKHPEMIRSRISTEAGVTAVQVPKPTAGEIEMLRTKVEAPKPKVKKKKAIKKKSSNQPLMKIKKGDKKPAKSAAPVERSLASFNSSAANKALNNFSQTASAAESLAGNSGQKGLETAKGEKVAINKNLGSFLDAQ